MNTTGRVRTFTLDELATLVDLPIRTVRYYIQLGLVDRPEGETRAARYGARHVEQLLAIRKWSNAGVSLDRIRDILAGEPSPVPTKPRRPGSVEVWSHLVVTDGLEIQLEPSRAELSPAQVRAFFRGALALYQDIAKKDSQ